MKVASVNVQDNPDHAPAVVLSYVRRVMLFLGVLSIVGFQEIGDDSDRAAIRKMFPAEKWYHLHFNTPTPMVIRKQAWLLRDMGKRLAIPGEKGFTPNRYVVWADVQRRLRRGRMGKMLRAVNIHQINGAWNGRFPETERRRQGLWNLMHKIMGEVVMDGHRKGYHVVFMGDWNREVVEKFHRTQVWVNNHRIDKIGVIAAKGYRTVRVTNGHMRRHQPMDHPPIWASFFFVKIRRVVS